MSPRLGELLYWMACWIAAIVAILGVSAIVGGRREDWVGVIAFFVSAGTIWIAGRILLFVSREK